MRKLVLLLAALWIYPSAEAQKIIYVTDSTTLRKYFIPTPPPPPSKQMTTDDKGRGTAESKAPETRPAPKPEHDSPIIRITRNDNAATLKKELSADISRLDWAPVLTGLGYLQYRAFINPEGRIDSLAYCLVHSDTTRTARGFRTRDKLHTIGQEDFRATLEKEWKHTLANFTGAASGSWTHGSVIYPSLTKAKNLQEFLSKKADDITEIDLTGYGLREFPSELKRFRKLKNINLKDNYISSATIDRKDFPNLVTVSFQNNLLRDGGLRFTGGKGPTAINLTDNHFTRIPKTYRKVRYLYLANSSITEISPKDIRKMKKVKFLNLYSNRITDITPKISRLKKLTELDLYRNQLTSLEPRITRLKKLETLAVSYNKLEELPAGIHSMTQLKTLYSHHNKLKTLPSLPLNLEILDVGYNRIEGVSERVQPLKKLKTLDYSNNQVKGDLDFLLGLPQIKEIYLLENRYAATEEEEKYFSRVFSELVNKGVTVK